MGALDGLVVLDLARRYPGALAAMVLADFGAEVIKVDPPPGAARLKRSDASEERFAAFYPQDRNKQTMILDLKVEAARGVFHRLAQRADVLIEGFRPGVTDRLGVGYARLKDVNPRLIYCALSGFGPDGPYAAIPAHDMNYIGLAGVLSLIGERNGRPYLPSNLVADYGGAGMHAVIGVLLALIARDQTGRGQFVDVAYLDSAISLVTGAAWQYFESGRLPKRGETPATGASPAVQAYRCKDGEYLTVAAAAAPHWANLCSALGRTDLLDRQNPATIEEADDVKRELQSVFGTRTRDEWWEYLREEKCGVAPVLNVDETFADPQVLHRKMLVEMYHPTVGRVRQTGIAIKMSDTPGQIRHLGLPTGTHTDAVLAGCEYTPAQILKLREAGALG